MQEARDPSTTKVQGLSNGTLQDYSGNGALWEVDWVQGGQEYDLLVAISPRRDPKTDTDAMIAEAHALSSRLP
jgi:hypothetical protein